MISGIRLFAEPMRSILYSDLSTTFSAIGDPLAYPCYIYAIQNFTDADVIWSWDGTTDHGILAASGGHMILDITTNKRWEQGLYLPVGLTTYAALISGATAPTMGSVYISVFYAVPNAAGL